MFLVLEISQAVYQAVDAAGVQSRRLTELADIMSLQLTKSRSEATTTKYLAAFKRWQTFIHEEGGVAIPAEPIHIALYISNLIDKGCSLSVMQSAVYAIKWAHTIRGSSDPTDNNFIRNLLEASKRTISKPIVKKDIVTSEQIINLCDKYGQSEDILILRDLAIIVLGFSGFLRFDEIRSLRGSDVKIHDGFLTLFLYKSKTDQYRRGNTVTIAKGNTTACPLKVVGEYFTKAGISFDSDQFIFRPTYCNKGKKALVKKNKQISYTRARETVLNRLREVCGDANIGLHSLRAGGATAAARASVQDRLWKRHGRWRSDKAKDGYVDDSLEHKLTVSQALGL